MNTHSAEELFNIPRWTDQSDHLNSLFFLDVLKAIRIKIFDKITYSPDGYKEYQRQKADFIRRHNIDAHYDFKEKEYIPGLLNQIGTYTDEKPLYFNKYLLIALDLVMLGWI